MSEHPLDNPAWHSLRTRHADLALSGAEAARYRPEVSALAALAAVTPSALEDLAKLVDPDAHVLVVGVDSLDDRELGPAWRRGDSLELAQMVCEAPVTEPDLPVTALGPDDVDDVMELVGLTVPGPFERGTLEMGRYVGLREAGRLVAMAGERLKPEGYTEISAVCTHPDCQGRGLGEAFVRAVAGPIQRAGDVPFLHVFTGNERAIALYERLGFVKRAQRVISPLVRQA